MSFGLGEMASPGSFFLAPFAVGAAVASAASFLGAPIGLGWALFLVASFASFAALRPLARRLELSSRSPVGVGATRLLGDAGVVLDPVPEGTGELGLVRIGREEWRAESFDGSAIDPGTQVTVLEVRGTRVVVYPTGRPSPPLPPSPNPTHREP